MYCLCVNVYCHRVTTQLGLINIYLRHLVKRDCHGADFHETRASQVSVSK